MIETIVKIAMTIYIISIVSLLIIGGITNNIVFAYWLIAVLGAGMIGVLALIIWKGF